MALSTKNIERMWIILAQLRDLLVTGTSRFLGKVYTKQIVGNLTGNADTTTKL